MAERLALRRPATCRKIRCQFQTDEYIGRSSFCHGMRAFWDRFRSESTKDRAFRNQQRQTFLTIPSRRYLRNETLRVSDLMSLRGTAARGTISGRRPPVRVPWPYGITVQLVPESKFGSASHVLARSLFVQFEWCTEQVPWAPPAFQARIGRRDARTGS